MRILSLLLLLACAASAAAQSPARPRIPSAQEDLAWLDRYLDANAAGSRRVQLHTGDEIAFNSLPDRIGARIAVTLRDGRSRAGVLVAANGENARLRVRLAAGEYVFEFSRANAQRITAGEG
jgi:hypothetical protein